MADQPPKYLVVEMVKTFNTNTAGDVCAFSEDVALQLAKKEACKVLGPIDVATETWDVVQKKAVPKRKASAAA